MFQYHYQLDDKGYLSLISDLQLHGKSRRKLRVFTRLAVCALVLAAWIGAFIGQPPDIPVMALTFAILAAVAALCLTALYKSITGLGLRMNVWMLKRFGGLPYDRDVTLIFEEDALTYNTGAMESKTQYSAIKGVDICRQAVFLRLDAMRVYILPLTCFPTDDEKNRFIAFIKQRLP